MCSANPPAILGRDGWLVGTRMYAWQVAETFDRRGSVNAVASESGLSSHQVRVALEWAERSELAHPSTI